MVAGLVKGWGGRLDVAGVLDLVDGKPGICDRLEAYTDALNALTVGKPRPRQTWPWPRSGVPPRASRYPRWAPPWPHCGAWTRR